MISILYRIKYEKLRSSSEGTTIVLYCFKTEANLEKLDISKCDADVVLLPTKRRHGRANKDHV